MLKNVAVTVGTPPIAVTIHVWGSFNDNLHQYREAWLALTSPEGRKWIREQLDPLLDYIEKLVKA